MLLYIQRKMYLDEPLDLGLNSATEVFDIIITSLKLLTKDGKELTLDDYEELLEYTISEDFHDFQMKDYMQCKTCNYGTYNINDKLFEKHYCECEGNEE